MKDKHIPEVRKDNPDLDRNREEQSDRAWEAFEKGYTHAIRHANDGACDWCLEHDNEVVPIEDVISERADHKYGQCSWEFITEDEIEEEDQEFQ